MQVIDIKIQLAEVLSIPVQIGGTETAATVDSGAQMTVINSKYYDSIERQGLQEFIMLRGLHRELKKAIVQTCTIKINDVEYRLPVSIADMQDDMLLGIDFLRIFDCRLDLKNNALIIGNNKVTAVRKETTQMQGDQEARTARVILEHDLKIEPRSGAVALMKLDGPIKGQMIVENLMFNSDVFLPNVLIDNSTSLELLILNLKNKPYCLKQGRIVATATPVSQEEEPTPPSKEADLPDQTSTKPERGLPEHLQGLFTKSKVCLNEEEGKQLEELLIDYQDVFATSELDIGLFKGIKHSIDTGDARPIRHKMRRTPIHFQKEEEAHLRKLLDQGIIRPSQSEWAAAPVLVRKKDGGLRWCIDYRALNKVTIKDAFPLPNIEDCIELLAGSMYLSCLDCCQGYYNLEIVEKDKEKSSFITKYGLFEHNRLPFGLCTAPATFQRAIQLVLAGLTWKSVIAYLDDTIVLGLSFEMHLENLQEVLERFRKHNLKLKASKCVLFQKKVKWLGRIIEQGVISVNPENIKAVHDWKVPTTVRGLQAFLGFINYHRAHLPKLAEIAVPLYQLTRKNTEFIWSPTHEEAFQTLKTAMVTPPILVLPNSTDPFILDTDASAFAVSGVLSQVQDKVEKVVAYASASLTPPQRRYCTTRRELLAVLVFIRHFRHHLLHKQFLVRTDHSSLVWLLNFKVADGQIARWAEELSQYQFALQYRKGELHGNADGLSRQEELEDTCWRFEEGVRPEHLPCAKDQCRHCPRLFDRWSRFFREVDNIGNLGQQTVKITPVQIWVPQLTHAEILEAQQNDPHLRQITSWLTHGEPEEAMLQLASQTTKTLWLNQELLLLEQGILRYKYSCANGTRNLFIIPRDKVKEILSAYHDNSATGHLGMAKTLKRVRQTYFWANQKRDVKEYVESCRLCNLNKKPLTPVAPLGSYHAGIPMERLNVDLVGPLPRTKRGNVYILMAVDQFSKWMECIPLPNQTAITVAKALVEEIFLRLGCPLEMHSDQGTNFLSGVLQSVCDLLQVHRTRTTSYRPRSNGQAERFNRSIMPLLRIHAQAHDEDWDEALPYIASAMRSTVHRSTGFTANQLMLGREISMPVDLLLNPEIEEAGEEELTTHEYVNQVRKTMEYTHELARQALKGAQERQKRNYDKRIRHKAHNVGDLVYRLEDAPKNKLQPRYRGPYVVEERLTPALYRLRDKNGVEPQLRHYDKLKPCKTTELPRWITRHTQEQREEAAAEETEDSAQTEVAVQTEDSASSDDDVPPDEIESESEAEEAAAADPGPREAIQRGRRRDDNLIPVLPNPAGSRAADRRGRITRPPPRFDDYHFV